MKFRKKPVVIDALQWTGDNLDEIQCFCEGSTSFDNGRLTIHTLEGGMLASEGDFIIRGVKGEFYPCKADIFEATYEKA